MLNISLLLKYGTIPIFTSFWNETLETFTADCQPFRFQSTSSLLNVRQLHFEDIEWFPFNLDQGFNGTAIHQMLAKEQNNIIYDISDNCVMMPRGIAVTCDWALLLPCFYGDLSIQPKTIFVHHLMLPHFAYVILPTIPKHCRFVLVSSGTDQTIPTGRGDSRFQTIDGFADREDGGFLWQFLTTHPQILHWYCENHDLNNANVSTLPLGVVEGVQGMAHIDIASRWIPLEKRPLKFLVSHRLRTGLGQWSTRANVSRMCELQQRTFTKRLSLCVAPPVTIQRDHRRGIAQSVYMAFAQRVSFIVCVHGGGIDPSPKAWEAIMMGTIPIIQHSTLDDAYAHLPVAFINDWSELFGDLELVRRKLEVMRATLSPYYTNQDLRAMVLKRLKMAYWSNLILQKYYEKNK